MNDQSKSLLGSASVDPDKVETVSHADAMPQAAQDGGLGTQAREGEAVAWLYETVSGTKTASVEPLSRINGDKVYGTALYTHPAAPSADKLREVRQDVINQMADNIEKLALTPAKRELVKAAFRACIGRLSTPDALKGDAK